MTPRELLRLMTTEMAAAGVPDADVDASLLLAHGDDLRLPDSIISSEYITLEGRKISTSQNWAVWAKDLAEEYNPDSIRYFFIANGPEKRNRYKSIKICIQRNAK